MKKAIKKTFNIIIDIVVVLILIVSLLVVVLSLTSKSSGVPNIFGIAPLSVQSDSMEPTFSENDLLFSKVTNDPGMEYQVGDVVTFPITIRDKEELNSHRIIEVVEEDGITYYKTKGDNNPDPDSEMVTSLDIVAKWTGNKISGIGGFLSFIRTQLGFFLVILLPMILFFIYEAIRVIMNIIAYNKEKAAEAAAEAVANSELTEEQKQRAIEEYLAQQRKIQEETESEVQTPAADEDSEAEQTADSE